MGVSLNLPLTEYDTTKTHPLGDKVQIGSKSYRYCYNAGADTLAAGEIVGQHTNSTYGNVTGTVATFVDGTSTCGLGLGMAMSAAPTLNYLWVQTGGANDVAITTDGSVAEGDGLVVEGGASPDGTLDTMADGEEEMVIGVAIDADTSGSAMAIGTAVLSMDKNW